MNKNFSSMKTTVGNNCQDTSVNFLSLISNWINDRLTEVQRRANYIQTATLDYSVSASDEDIVLPYDFKDAVRVLDKTNKVILTQIDIQEWVNRYKDAIDTSGTVDTYCISQDVVQKQPTSASVVTFASNSASDTTQTAYVRGIVSGVEDYETVTLSGTSNASTTKQFTKILGWGKDSVTMGAVTATTNSGAVTLGTLSRESLRHRVYKMRLGRIPSSAITLEIIYTQKQIQLSQANDYPILDCEDVLEAGATADALRYKRQYAKADYWESVFEKRLDDWMWSKENASDRSHFFKPQPYNRDQI